MQTISSILASALALAAPAAPAMPAPPPAASAIIPLPLYPVIGGDKRACDKRTASGLGYSVLKASAATGPGATDVALVNYIGYLFKDGQVFDQAMEVPMPVDRVVPGFGEGLRLMGPGAIYRLCVPAALGYGAQASGPIPANSDLVFQVEMLEFRTLAELEAIRARQGRQAPPRE